jgi:Asp-tRNA(Asn)/Glu-tRNA(Gln) amidotransferase A subunit family amidase
VSKKWYSYFVIADESQQSPAGGEPPVPAPRRAADLVPEVPTEANPPGVVPAETAASALPVPPAADLAIVYESAKIAAPAHGYTVLKVAEMLRSEHIRSLPPDVRAKSVLVALDAAGVKVDEVVEDAVRRDRALDTYERVLQQHVDDLAGTVAEENRRAEEEIAARIAEIRARIDENTRRVAAERAEFEAWRTRKQQEEALIADAVGHFVSENPVTRTPPAGSQGDANVR